jgi:hypothetical protein
MNPPVQGDGWPQRRPGVPKAVRARRLAGRCGACVRAPRPDDRVGVPLRPAEVGIGHEHHHHPIGWHRSRVPPAVPDRLDQGEATIGGGAAVLHGHPDQAVHDMSAGAQRTRQAGPAARRIHHRPDCHPVRPTVPVQGQAPGVPRRRGAGGDAHTLDQPHAGGQAQVEPSPVKVPPVPVGAGDERIGRQLRPAPGAAGAERWRHLGGRPIRTEPEAGQDLPSGRRYRLPQPDPLVAGCLDHHDVQPHPRQRERRRGACRATTDHGDVVGQASHLPRQPGPCSGRPHATWRRSAAAPAGTGSRPGCGRWPGPGTGRLPPATSGTSR